jgi:hypothetical protein
MTLLNNYRTIKLRLPTNEKASELIGSFFMVAPRGIEPRFSG